MLGPLCQPPLTQLYLLGGQLCRALRFCGRLVGLCACNNIGILPVLSFQAWTQQEDVGSTGQQQCPDQEDLDDQRAAIGGREQLFPRGQVKGGTEWAGY